MNRWTKAAIVTGVVIVLGSIILALALSFKALDTANNVIESKDKELKSKNHELDEREHDIMVVRDARDAWADTARKTNEEKVTINCVQFDRVNGFVSLIANILEDTPELPPGQRQELGPYLETTPRPAECPPITN